MLLNKEKIKEALEYYSVKDIDYHEKCNRCIDEINNNKFVIKDMINKNQTELSFNDIKNISKILVKD